MTEKKEGVGTPTPQLQKFYLTFGVQYSHLPHPTWPGAHPDGWVLIEAVNEDRARGLAYLYFKQNWSMLTPENHFPAELNKRQYYPLGEIARIRVGESTVPGNRCWFEAPAYAEQINGTSDPLYYGVMTNARVGCRIEGHLKEDPDTEMYDVEYVHTECFPAGLALFSGIMETDENVLAFELDWAQPYPCPVCGVSLT
jgi:hypothetical protein